MLTVEPGLYFQEDDLLVPEELRGIGIRIEDDILVTADGCAEPLRRPPPHLRRRRGVDGPAARLTTGTRWTATTTTRFRCRSCSLLEIPRPQQLSDKEAHARSLVPAPVWLPTIAGPDAGFRNKAKMVVGGTAGRPHARDPRPRRTTASTCVTAACTPPA